MSWYDLCTGMDLSQCHTCERLIDRHAEEAAIRKTWIKPQVAHGKCADWKPKLQRSKEDKL